MPRCLRGLRPEAVPTGSEQRPNTQPAHLSFVHTFDLGKLGCKMVAELGTAEFGRSERADIEPVFALYVHEYELTTRPEPAEQLTLVQAKHL